jgi:hypothetical protein
VSRPTPERAHHVLLAPGGSGGIEPSQFEAWCQAHRGARCVVWLAAELTLPLLTEPGAVFADEAAVAAYARRVLSHYDHETQGAAAAWRSRRRTGICLMLAPADAQALREAANRHAVRLEGLRPLWTGALALALLEHPALQDQGCLLVAERCIVTAIEFAGGSMARLQRHWLARDDAGDLLRLAQELGSTGSVVLALGHGLPGEPPSALRAIGSLAQEPAALLAQLDKAAFRGMAPDFAPAPMPRLRSLGWVLAGTAVSVLALAVGSAYDAYEALNAQADPAAEISNIESPSPGAALARADGEHKALPAARVALARLDYPWQALFMASEAATPRGGTWLRFEHQASQSEMRLSGLASSTEEALAVAQRLARAPGITDAFVSRSEPRESGAVEFDVSVRPAVAGGRP